MCLFEILKAREFFVEILGEMEDFLWCVEDLIFSGLANLDQLLNDANIDELLLLQLFTNL